MGKPITSHYPVPLRQAQGDLEEESPQPPLQGGTLATLAQITESCGNVTVRLAGETRKKLDHIAADLDRSRNWLINEAIENYLEVYEWQEQKIRERLKKAEKKGKFRTAKQVSRVVDSFKP